MVVVENKYIIKNIKEEFKERGYELLSSHDFNSVAEKLEYICLKHKGNGVLTIRYSDFTRGKGCKYCGIEKVSMCRHIDENKLKTLTEEKGFIYCGVFYKNEKSHINFMCKNHLEKGVQTTAYSNLKKYKSFGKCPYCLGINKSHQDFIKGLSKVNTNIKILGNYVNATTKIRCQCLVDNNVWYATPNSLLRGRGCPICGRIKANNNTRKSHDKFIGEIKRLKPNIEILTNYIGCDELIECRCKIDSTIWETTPTSLLNTAVGCPTCISKETGDRCRKTNEQFLKELKQMNPDILPLEEYHDIHTKIKCKCLKHNYEWLASPDKILFRKTGCPKCANYHNEMTLDEILTKWGFKYIIQKRFDDCRDKNTLPFDKYLEDFNILIEYDGEGHDRPICRGNMTNEEAIRQFELVQKHDSIKTEYCKKNNIPLIRIPYWERENMEYFLFCELVKYGAIEEINIAS